MDQKWKSALVLIPLFVVIAAIWMYRSRPEGGDATCIDAPGRPTNLTVTKGPATPGIANAAGRVTLTWAAPATGDAPTMYVIEAGSAPGANNIGNYVSNATSFTTDAPAGTYYGRVRAQNACGSSEPSDEVTVEVP
jgi:hypothetical protein